VLDYAGFIEAGETINRVKTKLG